MCEIFCDDHNMLVTIDQASGILFCQLSYSTVDCTWFLCIPFLYRFACLPSAYSCFSSHCPTNTHTHPTVFLFLICSAQLDTSIVVWKCHLTRFFHLKCVQTLSLLKTHHIMNVCYMCIFLHV